MHATLPYVLVENAELRNVFQELDASYSPLCVKSLVVNVLSNFESKIRDYIRKELSAVDYIGISFDEWTSNHNDNYLTIIARYVTQSFKLRSFVLRTTAEHLNQTHEEISRQVISVLDDYGIKRTQVFSCTTDGALLSVAISNFPNANGVWCFCHILNLAIKDGLFIDEKKENIHDDNDRFLIEQIRYIKKLVEYFSSSSKASGELRNALGEEKADSLLKATDIRWNSYFYMFERVIRFRNSLEVACASLNKLDKVKNIDFNFLAELMLILSPCEKASKLCQSETATIGFLYCITGLLVQNLRTLEVKHDSTLRVLNRIISGLSRLDTIPNTLGYVPIMGMVLDPRTKDYLIRFPVEQVRETEILLFKEIGIDRSIASQVTPSSGIQPIILPSFKKRKLEDVFIDSPVVDLQVADVNDNLVESALSELALYLGEDAATFESSPCDWWDSKVKQFPLLSSVARKYLCISPSSAECERLFSLAGQVIDEYSSRITPAHADTRIFLSYNLNKNPSFREKLLALNP